MPNPTDDEITAALLAEMEYFPTVYGDDQAAALLIPAVRRLIRLSHDLPSDPTEPDPETLRVLRSNLLNSMSFTSESEWCASWLNGLDRILHDRGGIWEITGRAIGWPLGYEAEDGWVTWDEATTYYETHPPE